MWIYTALFAANGLALLAALRNWWRELRTIDEVGPAVTTRLIATVGTRSVELATDDGRTSIHLGTEHLSSLSARTILAATDRVVVERRLTLDSVTIRCADRRVLADIAAVLRSPGLDGLVVGGSSSNSSTRSWRPRRCGRSRPHAGPGGHHRGPDAPEETTTRRRLIGVGGVALTGTAVSGYLVGTRRADHRGFGGMAHDAGSPATVSVDELGSTDNERIARLNDRAGRSAGNYTPVYEFANRIYTISTPIKLFSGLKLRGTGGLSAREFDGGTVIFWQGGDDSSVSSFRPRASPVRPTRAMARPGTSPSRA